jgi:hypothetical protein
MTKALEMSREGSYRASAPKRAMLMRAKGTGPAALSELWRKEWSRAIC